MFMVPLFWATLNPKPYLQSSALQDAIRHGPTWAQGLGFKGLGFKGLRFIVNGSRSRVGMPKSGQKSCNWVESRHKHSELHCIPFPVPP